MVDPVSTLLLAVEKAVALLPAAKLAPARAGARLPERLAEACGRIAPPGVAAFLSRYDGGTLGRDTRLLSFEESFTLKRDPRRAADLKGLWPIADRHGHLFALDAEYPGSEGEWPVVELADRSVDRAGSTFLRYLQALLADLRMGPEADELTRARELCRCDPGLAEHWVDLVEVLERDENGAASVDEAIAEALRRADPPGPALVLALGLRAVDKGEAEVVRVALEDAIELEPLTARDDDARLDAAAISFVLAREAGDEPRTARALELLGAAAASTGAYWRGEAIRALAAGRHSRADLSLRVLGALLAEDTDGARLRALGPGSLPALKTLIRAREALDEAAFEDAVRAAKTALAELPELGVAHATLAEALNARRDRGGVEAARRATELNPALTDAWRELGDGCLELRQASNAEAAYRELVRRDPSNGLGLAKLAQAQLEQGRTREALESIEFAAERGGDAFFVNAVRGDILSEMNRHEDAAEAYDQALFVEPDDHWALHQAALEHGRAGQTERAIELFERALTHDSEGCHQTLVDYADVLRRVGRIGDAVRLYRKAVAAVPNDPEWRQVLREAERELQSAPN
jgi:tetratricopeptide (TPR) repeat protein